MRLRPIPLSNREFPAIRGGLPLLLIFSFLLWPSLLVGQNFMQWENDPASSPTAPETEPDPYLAQAQPVDPPTGNSGGQGQPGDGGLYGFAETPWKSTYQEVKARFQALATSTDATEKVEIVNAKRNQMLLIRRNGILYRYSFYKTPFDVVKLTNHQITQEEWDATDALLFHVRVTPIFLDSDLVRQKLENAYGRRTRSTLDKKKGSGADIWELPGGFIFQWHEPYRGKPYTRTLDYISKELAEQVMKERDDFFLAEEKEILQKLIVN